jgi:hypothetical protein
MAKREPTVMTLFGGIPDPATTAQASSVVHLSESNIVPGGLSFGFTPQVPQDGRRTVGRRESQAIAFASLAAPTETRVDHDLGRVPRRFSVIHKDGACDVYRGTNPWNTSTIWLLCSNGAVNVTVELA